MFWRKRVGELWSEIIRLEGVIVSMDIELKSLKTKSEMVPTACINPLSVVSCDTCGCLLYLHDAVKGKSEIRSREIWKKDDCGYGLHKLEEEYIHTPFYCKVHRQEKGGWE